MKTTSLRLIAGLVALGVTAGTAQATVFAYEGFDAPEINGVPGVPAPNETTLNNVTASTTGAGFGFTGAWVVSNGNSTDSKYLSSGLSFPGSYPGSYSAIGGGGINKGNTSNSMLRLNFDAGVATSVNAAGTVYVSWLAQRVGPVTPGFDNPYPRNAGARFLNNATPNNNTSMGLLGYNGSLAENNGVGAWGWKDTNGLMTTPLAEYVSAADFLVAELDFTNSMVTLWVNPQEDGSSEGSLSFSYTDNGTPVVMALYAFGVEAGSNSSGREPGEWLFDEIRVADSFADAAGFTMVPEPGTYALIFGLLAAVGVFIHRRRKA